MARDAFGRELRKRRIAAEKTLKDVADFLRVSIPYVSDVELGRRQPFAGKSIEDLAAFFACTEAQKQLLRVLAVRDRGEITLVARSDSARELLVALDRRIETLDDDTVKRITKLLDEGGAK